MPALHSQDLEASNKRQRIEVARKPDASSPQSTRTHSRILAPYRSIGHITAPDTPFSVYSLGTGTFQITTSVGNTLQTYDVKHLHLVFVTTPCTPSTIRRIVATKDVVYAAFGGSQSDPMHGVWIFKRGKKIGELEEPTGGWRLDWKEFVVFGDWAVGAFGNGDIVVWKVGTREVHTEIMTGKNGGVVGLIHPNTHLHKIVVARTGGNLEIWNVKTGKLIYNCAPPIPNARITTLIQTTVLHHVAFATANSQIHIHNILTDTPLFTLAPKTITNKKITSLSFCTDPSVGAGTSPEGRLQSQSSGRILAAGDDEGDITLWDLEKRRIVGVMRNAHSSVGGGIVRCEFLNGQKVMITTGGDNSLKEWIFDSPHTVLPRILRQRSGHSAPPTTLTFHDPAESHFLLSSSQDRTLWSLSLRRDNQSFELSQGSAGPSKKTKKANLREHIAESKAPPITAIAISDSDGAKRDWENILTAHRGEKAARTWHFQMKRLGRWVFPTGDEGEAKCVGISACGNFGFVGSSKGGVDMWNLQSGIKRGTFPKKAQVAKRQSALAASGPKKDFGTKHEGAVTGILTDATNSWIATTGLDGKIKIWDFMGNHLLHEIDLSTAITTARLYRANDLLAVSCDDLCIRVIDTETKKVVRELWGCGGRISDFCFSNDGRWIIAASLDSTIRIWDLPTGNLIDGVKTRSIVTALAWSGRGEYLVTGHVDDVGVNLWTNRTLFTHVPTRRLKEENIMEINMPTSSGEGGVGILDAAIDPKAVVGEAEAAAVEDEGDHSGIYVTKEQLSDKMLTLSLVPRTRWQTLLHLDIIKQRNKPEKAPTKPEKAPFFLGALPGIKDASNPNTLNNTLLNPSVSSSSFSALTQNTNTTDTAALAAERSRISRLAVAAQQNGSAITTESTTLLEESLATRLLRQCASSSPSNRDFTPFITHFKTLPPSSADLEIRSLISPYWDLLASSDGSEEGDEEDQHTTWEGFLDSDLEEVEEEEPFDELATFITALTARLKQNLDYELLNAWMSVLLRVHGESIVQVLSCLPRIDSDGGSGEGKEKGKSKKEKMKIKRAERLDRALREWKGEQERERERVLGLVGYCVGVVGFLKGGR